MHFIPGGLLKRLHYAHVQFFVTLAPTPWLDGKPQPCLEEYVPVAMCFFLNRLFVHIALQSGALTISLPAGKHTIFGRVSGGMGVVKRLGNIATGESLQGIAQAGFGKMTGCLLIPPQSM